MKFILPLICVLALTACDAQKEKSTLQVGGPCEGCEAVNESGDRVLSALDTLPFFEENEPKLKVTGKVYQKDGRTPASDVILYVYHTNKAGVYQAKAGATGWAARHGSVRSWLKTDNQGRYTFYTFWPGTYPDGSEPAHIHVFVKEPGLAEYYIDSYHFEGDPLLTPKVRKAFPNRGGSGIVRPVKQDGRWEVRRDIILGKNIPYYHEGEHSS